MAKKVKPIPEGYHSVTPYLAIDDGARAIDFYKSAFGAEEVTRMNGPDGRVAHAELKIGDSMVMLGSAPPNSGVRSPQSLNGSSVSIFVYFDNVDSVFNRALSEGAHQEQALANQFWGDRFGRLIDPFGHSWSLAQHVEDVAPEEMQRRMEEATKAASQRAHAAGHGGHN